MASMVPLKERKLVDIKPEELPSWKLMLEFTLSGIRGAFQGEHEQLQKYH
ncbi:PREDICTED: ATP synthase subunit f, mitochondrial-like isoform X2 [Elephantulus edwardii]|nr:PREDICTED: ATP synthase subunit f, mitochondrial-like isoform X2 [Elephantulus edwardii]